MAVTKSVTRRLGVKQGAFPIAAAMSAMPPAATIDMKSINPRGWHRRASLNLPRAASESDVVTPQKAQGTLNHCIVRHGCSPNHS